MYKHILIFLWNVDLILLLLPGPSSPPAVQQDSASSTVLVQLVPSASDIILENIVQEHLIK